jgi:hypothetical protein
MSCVVSLPLGLKSFFHSCFRTRNHRVRRGPPGNQVTEVLLLVVKTELSLSRKSLSASPIRSNNEDMNGLYSFIECFDNRGPFKSITLSVEGTSKTR